MKAAVKYCGGCNPRYDRVALVERIVRECCLTPVGLGVADTDVAFVVNGCSRACASQTEIREARSKFVIDTPERCDIILEALNSERR